MNKTRLYNLKSMQIGQSVRLPKGWDMQHARVAASDYGRRHNKVFTCRMQEDGSMLIYRCELTQRDIDRRGAVSMREIPSTEIMTLAHVLAPTKEQFTQWLASFAVGQTATLKSQYKPSYKDMVGYVIDYALSTGKGLSTSVSADGLLIIQRTT